MDFTKDIYINKEKVYENEEIVVLYKGFLFSDNLTNEVYISYGYGDLWENKNEIKMKPSTFGYLATIKVDSGENLQFGFKDSNNVWDNNNGQNYILPIYESQEILSFKTIADTSKEIKFDLFEPKLEEIQPTQNDVFATSVVESDSVELYKTIGLENSGKQSIPDDTKITQIRFNEENEKIVSSAIIKAEEQPEDSVSVAFASLTEKAKEQSVKAFDEDKVTAGSVYVNSIVKDIPDQPQKVENITEKSILVKDEVSLSEKVTSFFKAFAQTAKLAFSKLVKLIKTSLNFEDDNN